MTASTSLYAGPSDVDFETIAQLTTGAKVTPLAVYGDFAEVQFEISGTVQIGFIPKWSCESLPFGLPNSSDGKMPLRNVQVYAADNVGTFHNTSSNFLNQSLLVGQSPITNPRQIDFSVDIESQTVITNAVASIGFSNNKSGSDNRGVLFSYSEGNWWLGLFQGGNILRRADMRQLRTDSTKSLALSVRVARDGSSVNAVYPDGKQEQLTFSDSLYAKGNEIGFNVSVSPGFGIKIKNLSIKQPPDGKLVLAPLLEPQSARIKMPWSDKTGNDFYFDFSQVPAQRTRDIAVSVLWRYASFSTYSSDNMIRYYNDFVSRYGDPRNPLGLKPTTGVYTGWMEMWARAQRGRGFAMNAQYGWYAPSFNVFNVEVLLMGKPIRSEAIGRDVIPLKIRTIDGKIRVILVTTDGSVRVNIPSIWDTRVPPGAFQNHFGEVTRSIQVGMFKPGMVIGLNSGDSAKSFFASDQGQFMETKGVTLYVFVTCEDMQVLCPPNWDQPFKSPE